MTQPTTNDLASGPRDPAQPSDDAARLAADVERACRRIAPTWPLDRFIAVNPFWHMIDRPLSEVGAELSSLSGTRLLMPRDWYRAQLQAGRLLAADVEDALGRAGQDLGVADVERLLARQAPPPGRCSRVVDVVDAGRDLTHAISFREWITTSCSELCAAYFDEGQASLGPPREGGLYATWLRQARLDRAPRVLMGLGGYERAVAQLPASAEEMIALAVVELQVPLEERERYFTALLLDQLGWASYCAYLRWTARLAGGDDPSLVDLLAMRLAWEWLLLRTGSSEVAHRWRNAKGQWPVLRRAAKEAQASDWAVHEALERSVQRAFCRRLSTSWTPEARPAPELQAVFCIDVRSEVLRRALESVSPSIQTLGFAGFFGLPVAYRPLSAPEAEPRLPGLLAPKLGVVEVAPDEVGRRRTERGAREASLSRVRTGTLSGLAFVESMGWLYAVDLALDSLGARGAERAEHARLTRAEQCSVEPRLAMLGSHDAPPLSTKVDLAAGMLRAMALTRPLARLVLLAGHASATRNNPHAAGLDCGACCGQSGEVNARVAAALLNEPAVRGGLAERGISLPPSTHFLAALHDTTTDEVTLLDTDEVPASHAADVEAARARLDRASASARAERARRLGLGSLAGQPLHASVRSRARDWAEVRPEWGLADNAAFIAAPRERTRDLDLHGRAFLHEYRAEDDPDFAILELIMTAPMVVAHWINMQYFASTVDNARYGSGNKLLHSVVGGHLGVLEGNGGDLRIGLPLQSLHDGEGWVHTPVRLSVFLEAPRDAISAVLAKHASVRDLVENGWLALFQLSPAERSLFAYREGRWTRVADETV